MSDDDDVCYSICERQKLEGETENMGVCTKERQGVTAEVLMATPCTKSLGGESGGHKHEGRVSGFAGKGSVFREHSVIHLRGEL